MDIMEKNFFPLPEFKPRAVHLVASHFTHYAIPAQDIHLEVLRNVEVAKGLRQGGQ